MQNGYKNIEEYNPNTMPKMLLVFDDMIADMIFNQNVNPVVSKIYIRGRKLNIYFAFITQPYFKVPKCVETLFTTSL